MAKTFPLLDETYSKQKISIFQHFLTTMFCKKKLPRMLVPQNVEKGLPCAFFQVAVLLCLLYVPPLPSPPLPSPPLPFYRSKNNSSLPIISVQVLLTDLYRFPMVLTRRSCPTIKSLLSSRSLPLFSWP